MEDQAKNSRRRFNQSAWILTALVLLYIALMLNWQSQETGHLRFINSRLNLLAFATGQLIPIGILLSLFRVRYSWLKGIGCFVVGPVAILAMILFLFAFVGSFASNADIEEGCRLICSVSLGASKVSGYRTNGGALESYNVLIQQERTILPGIVWTKFLYQADPAAEVNLYVIDRHHVRCSFPPYDVSLPKKEDVIVVVD